MSRAFFVVLAALATLPCGAVSPAVSPFRTTMVGELPPLLPDEAHAFASIAATLRLGTGSELSERLENGSSIDPLHDYRGEAIFAVKPELLGPDGASVVRGPDGNYPFFVFRQLEHGCLLLGAMQGGSYEWSTRKPPPRVQHVSSASERRARHRSIRGGGERWLPRQPQ